VLFVRLPRNLTPVGMNKTIGIVGAGEGVGLAVAERFGREGFQVALLSRDLEKTEALVVRLRQRGIRAQGFKADVLDRDGMTYALDSVKQRFGSIDVLEYSPLPSGQLPPPRDLNVDDQEYHLALNVLGPITAVRAVLPDMLAKKSGSILFTSAASAQRPLIVTAPFGIAAGALLNYVRILNRDVSADGVFAGFVAIAGIVVPVGKRPTTPNIFRRRFRGSRLRRLLISTGGCTPRETAAKRLSAISSACMPSPTSAETEKKSSTPRGPTQSTRGTC
jgi:NAD(P)-dependent dehydrogenase (short-subunit alcohol dehydrogenase family)